VFTSYRNTTGFRSKSYVYMLGASCSSPSCSSLSSGTLMLPPLLAGWVLTCVATGMEASAHMAEDTKRPSRTVPLAMFWSVAATYIMGWVSICVLLAVRRLSRSRPFTSRCTGC